MPEHVPPAGGSAQPSKSEEARTGFGAAPSNRREALSAPCAGAEERRAACWRPRDGTVGARLAGERAAARVTSRAIFLHADDGRR